MSSVEPGGLLLTLEWQFYSPYLYMRHIENFRRDATVVDVNLMRRTWYVENYLPREYPEMINACRKEMDEFLEDLRLFDQDKPYDPARINTRFITLINAFIKFHMANHSAYTMIPMEDGVGRDYIWVPQGVTLRLFSDQNFHPETTPPLELRGMLDKTVYLDDVAKNKVRNTYALMMANRGKYLIAGRRYDEAFNYLRLALDLNPEFDRAYEFLGDMYAAQGKIEDAERSYREALLINPSNKIAQQRIQAIHSEPKN
jgi:tetratricopeptide (TPR) repeat protein